MPRKDKTIAALTGPFTIGSMLSSSCPGRILQVPSDSVVHMLVVDGLIRGADKGLFALIIDVKLCSGYPLFSKWSFRYFWRRRRLALGHDGVAQGLLCWA
jgi:hypothetical protein